MRKPLPAAEIAIGKRLREFRESLNLTRPTLAAQLGIPRETLASYENGRAPLPWGVFITMAESFALNPAWLASAQGHALAAFDIALAKIPANPRDRFSAVFAAHLPSAVPASKRPVRVDARELLRAADGLNQQLENLASADEEQRRKALLAPGLISAIGEAHTRTGSALFEAGSALAHRARAMPQGGGMSGSELKPERKPRLTFADESKEKDLTSHPKREYIPDMAKIASDLEGLLAEVRELASKPGMKAALARAMGVTPQRVSEWLSKASTARKPGGEYTMQLLNWVEEQKRK